MGGPGFFIQVHELAPIFGAASLTLHQLVDDESGELQRRALCSYKIWKRQKMLLDARQDFEKLVEIYDENVRLHPHDVDLFKGFICRMRAWIQKEFGDA